MRKFKIVSEKDDGKYYVDIFSINSYWDAVKKLDAAFPNNNHVNVRNFYWDRLQLNNNRELVYFKLIGNNLEEL